MSDMDTAAIVCIGIMIVSSIVGFIIGRAYEAWKRNP